MKIMTEVRLKGTCKYCGRTFELYRPFEKHLAYEHGIYHSKWYKFKANIRNMVNKFIAK